MAIRAPSFRRTGNCRRHSGVSTLRVEVFFKTRFLHLGRAWIRSHSTALHACRHASYRHDRAERVPAFATFGVGLPAVFSGRPELDHALFIEQRLMRFFYE